MQSKKYWGLSEMHGSNRMESVRLEVELTSFCLRADGHFRQIPLESSVKLGKWSLVLVGNWKSESWS